MLARRAGFRRTAPLDVGADGVGFMMDSPAANPLSEVLRRESEASCCDCPSGESVDGVPRLEGEDGKDMIVFGFLLHR